MCETHTHTNVVTSRLLEDRKTRKLKKENTDKQKEHLGETESTGEKRLFLFQAPNLLSQVHETLMLQHLFGSNKFPDVSKSSVWRQNAARATFSCSSRLSQLIGAAGLAFPSHRLKRPQSFQNLVLGFWFPWKQTQSPPPSQFGKEQSETTPLTQNRCFLEAKASRLTCGPRTGTPEAGTPCLGSGGGAPLPPLADAHLQSAPTHQTQEEVRFLLLL